ncbi:hypothetical protein RND81_05G023300 [Saponaria officinalis]|uniref:Reverse transcriptase domain-containing protein n=1 Tax=Saponaria officinalis TaxID=3572 RepID=A0AAW1KS26_SAPOF
MFADDLLLFCKGDVQSLMLILRTFSTFSTASGLTMSKGKSNAYFNGVAAGLKTEILQVSGLVEGSLPFKYLGVPIKTTRLTTQECKPLIDKIVNRIRGLGTRKLSYAGRLVLIKAVLKSLHNYWAMMFILPSGVIARIETICRNFLWDGGVDFKRSPLVSWDKNFSPSTTSTWYWRKICQIKDLFADAYQQNQWENQTGKEYTIAKGYEWIRDKGQKVSWTSLVWNSWTIPKHSLLA